MSASAHILQYLLSADGLNQSGRSQPALDPSALPVDGRNLGDLASFVHKLAAQVRYYDEQRNPQGDWQAFFEEIGGASESQLQAMLAGTGNLSPHLALLMAYFKAYSIVRDDINQLAKKRLDYYYEEVLRLRRTSARPDKVHVLFEPSKFAKPLLLKTGTELDGGKTSNGKPLHYALDSELVVTQAKIGASAAASVTSISAVRAFCSVLRMLQPCASAQRPPGALWARGNCLSRKTAAGWKPLLSAGLSLRLTCCCLKGCER